MNFFKVLGLVFGLAAFLKPFYMHLLPWDENSFIEKFYSEKRPPYIVVIALLGLALVALTWDNPQKAIKQNINVLIAMLTGGVIYALIFLAGWFVYQVSGVDLLVYLAVAAVSLAIGALLYLLMIKIAPNRYRDIEV